MPERSDRERLLGELISEAFSGEWGLDSPQLGFAKALVVRSTEIDDEGRVALRTAAERYIPTEKTTNKALRNNDILIESAGGSSARPVGRPAMVKMETGLPPVISSNFVKSLRFDEEAVTHPFVIHALRHLYNQPRFGVTQQKTTGIINLNFGEFKNLSIWIPTEIDRQTLIADILDAVDDAIIETDAVIDKLLAVRIGLTEDLLTFGIAKNGQPRSPGEIAETKLGLLPRDWTRRNLGSLAKAITSGSRGWAKYYSKIGAKFLRIGNLTREHINLRLDDLVYVMPPNGQEGSRTAVQAHDLLISITADLGIIGSIPPEFGEAYVNQHISLVRFKESNANPRWPAHFLSSRRSQLVFQKLNDHGAKAGINLPAVGQIEIPLPPRNEQDAIVDRLDAEDEEVARFRVERKKLTALRLGLREDLVTGRKPVLGVREAAE